MNTNNNTNESNYSITLDPLEVQQAIYFLNLAANSIYSKIAIPSNYSESARDRLVKDLSTCNKLISKLMVSTPR